jgi:FtsZ-binding cell division protein ZapB
MRAGASDYVTKGDLPRLRAAVERGLKETGERRRAERELRRRDAILDAVRFAAERLLGEAVGWEESIRAVLGRLGEATGVSRRADYARDLRRRRRFRSARGIPRPPRPTLDARAGAARGRDAGSTERARYGDPSPRRYPPLKSGRRDWYFYVPEA